MNDHRDISQPINNAVMHSSPELAALFASRYPTWYGLTLAELATVTSAEEIMLVDTTVSAEATLNDHAVNIAAFTAEHLFTVEARVVDGDESHATSIRGRHGLRAFSVSASVGVFGDSWPHSTPGSVRVSLEYEDGSTLTLPGGNNVPARDHEAITAFIPSLKHDLTTRA